MGGYPYINIDIVDAIAYIPVNAIVANQSSTEE
jgi:hypothetical protein